MITVILDFVFQIGMGLLVLFYAPKGYLALMASLGSFLLLLDLKNATKEKNRKIEESWHGKKENNG